MSAPLAPTQQLETIPFAVLVDEAWRSTRAWARRILVPAALLLAPAALAMQVLSGLWNMSLIGMDPSTFESGRFCGTIVIGGLAFMLLIVYFMFVFGAMMVATVRSLGGESPALGPSLRFYLRPRVWGTDMLAWLLVMLGFVACILPGLFLMAVWSLRVPVMVREGRFGWDALKRSWELLAHNPSGDFLRHPVVKVLLLVLLGIVLAQAISMVVQMPMVIASQVMVMRGMSRGEGADPQALMRGMLWLTIPVGVIASVLQLATQLYIDFATTHLYLDQVRRKEGADLGAALDRILGAAPPPPVEPGLA